LLFVYRNSKKEIISYSVKEIEDLILLEFPEFSIQSQNITENHQDHLV
jgi:hypothetical protein